jgi:hypothetical protein
MENNNIIKLDLATKMLAEISSIDDAKDLINLAEAARIYARQVELGLEAQNHAAEIKVRAQRRAGEILDGMEKAKGAKGNPGGQGAPIVRLQAVSAQTPTYAEIGITPRDAHVWQTIARMPADNFERTIQKTLEEKLEITTTGIYKQARYDYKRDERSSIEQDIYTPQGMDACQTPAYAIDPLIPYLYLNGYQTIWEPAAGECMLVDALWDCNFKVVSSDILTGENFFEFEPEHWDCLVTNPPFSIKFPWLERCYQLGKPFALLLPVEVIGTKTAQDLFERNGFEILLLDKRVDFKMPLKGWDAAGAQFATAWFTWHVLPQKVIFGKLKKS